MAALIIAVAQQKGGAGKTTTVVQLATAFRQAGQSVAVVDIDPQASLTGWVRLREHEQREAPEIRFAMVGGWRLGVELERLARDVDLVLVDTAPHAEAEAKAAIRAASLVLVPCQPSPPDIWASKATFELAAKERKQAHLLLNRVPARGRSVEEARAQLARSGWPIMTTWLGNRQSYVTSFAKGLGVIENEPRSAAADEVRALASEIGQVLG